MMGLGSRDLHPRATDGRRGGGIICEQESLRFYCVYMHICYCVEVDMCICMCICEVIRAISQYEAWKGHVFWNSRSSTVLKGR
jgi:hypothetical protein